MPAASRCTSRPLMLTIRLRFCSLNSWSMISPQAMLVQPFGAFEAPGVDVGQPIRNHIGFRLVRPKRRGCLHLLVPVSGPDAVSGTQTGGPREHVLCEFDPERFAQQFQDPPRI